ncbi:MAG: M14 family metallopeptidase [Ignavibacteriales bacterium]|nr:MAG: M14 family metallopeptidase [Ignavibacteriales bacterium]
MKNFVLIILQMATVAGILAAQNKIEANWITRFENSGYVSTSGYNETMKYFQQLDDNSDYAKLFSFGTSPQARDLKFFAITKQKEFDPAAFKSSGKPTLLIINGIHSGEIEGKDASMLLLREILITKEKENLLDKLNIIVIPIFSVDAHERISKYNRINQNGPEEMGWRTTSQNYNLNRDWLKADALEMQYMLQLISKWLPDFIVDTHTTDGADYQYTITYAVEHFANIYSGTAKFLDNKFVPFLTKEVEQNDYLIFPYVAFKDWSKGFESGVSDYAATPRFSTGYAAIQNRPALLVETHMMKPYKDRVFSTKVVLETVMRFMNDNADELINLNKEADVQSIENFSKEKKYFPVALKSTDKFSERPFKGFKFYTDSSSISGGSKLVYTNEKQTFNIRFYNDVVSSDSVQLPSAYLIPKEFSYLVDRLKLHGVEAETLTENKTMEVTRYRFKNIKLSSASNEGRQRVGFDYDTFSEKVNVPAGTYIIRTDQRTLRVIAHALEPRSDDSFVKWGFMNSIFEQKEYFESYVMEKVAEQMLKDDPQLKKEFEKLLNENEEFRRNPRERLNFFYKLSPYWDKQLNLYPVMRIE